MTKKWEPVIGLEIHAQLSTRSKLFSTSSTAYGAPPNTQANLIDLGYPGVLPVLNEKALEFAIRFGLAIGAKIEKQCVFARKNYFYPDLPKGYQISQSDQPIVSEGCVEIEREDGSTFNVGIERAHLEEDAGKSIHDRFSKKTAIDLNRSGVPLLEIVSKPQLFSIEDAVLYAKWIHNLVEYLEICDGNMQEGSLRCDANVSLRACGSNTLGTRAEIKNLNSFRYLAKAIEYEIHRQSERLDAGQPVVQETRLYNAKSDETRSMRSKENANDYRYFPDPDLLPVRVSDALIQSVKEKIVELPTEKKQRFIHDYGIVPYDAGVLVGQKKLANYFERVCQKLSKKSYVLASNWVLSNLLGALNKQQIGIEDSPIKPDDLSDLLILLEKEEIGSKIAKSVFESMIESGKKPTDIIAEKNLKQINNSDELQPLLVEIIVKNPNQVAQYKAGKDKLFGFFVGQAMKATQGQANPTVLNTLLKKLLSEKSD